MTLQQKLTDSGSWSCLRWTREWSCESAASPESAEPCLPAADLGNRTGRWRIHRGHRSPTLSWMFPAVELRLWSRKKSKLSLCSQRLFVRRYDAPDAGSRATLQFGAKISEHAQCTRKWQTVLPNNQLATRAAKKKSEAKTAARSRSLARKKKCTSAELGGCSIVVLVEAWAPCPKLIDRRTMQSS